MAAGIKATSWGHVGLMDLAAASWPFVYILPAYCSDWTGPNQELCFVRTPRLTEVLLITPSNEPRSLGLLANNGFVHVQMLQMYKRDKRKRKMERRNLAKVGLVLQLMGLRWMEFCSKRWRSGLEFLPQTSLARSSIILFIWCRKAEKGHRKEQRKQKKTQLWLSINENNHHQPTLVQM